MVLFQVLRREAPSLVLCGASPNDNKTAPARSVSKEHTSRAKQPDTPFVRTDCQPVVQATTRRARNGANPDITVEKQSYTPSHGKYDWLRGASRPLPPKSEKKNKIDASPPLLEHQPSTPKPEVEDAAKELPKLSQRIRNSRELAEWPGLRTVVPDALQQLSSDDIAALMLTGAGNLDTVFVMISALRRGAEEAAHTLPAQTGLLMAAKSQLCDKRQPIVPKPPESSTRTSSKRRRGESIKKEATAKNSNFSPSLGFKDQAPSLRTETVAKDSENIVESTEVSIEAIVEQETGTCVEACQEISSSGSIAELSMDIVETENERNSDPVHFLPKKRIVHQPSSALQVERALDVNATDCGLISHTREPNTISTCGTRDAHVTDESHSIRETGGFRQGNGEGFTREATQQVARMTMKTQNPVDSHFVLDNTVHQDIHSVDLAHLARTQQFECAIEAKIAPELQRGERTEESITVEANRGAARNAKVQSMEANNATETMAIERIAPSAAGPSVEETLSNTKPQRCIPKEKSDFSCLRHNASSTNFDGLNKSSQSSQAEQSTTTELPDKNMVRVSKQLPGDPESNIAQASKSRTQATEADSSRSRMRENLDEEDSPHLSVDHRTDDAPLGDAKESSSNSESEISSDEEDWDVEFAEEQVLDFSNVQAPMEKETTKTELHRHTTTKMSTTALSSDDKLLKSAQKSAGSAATVKPPVARSTSNELEDFVPTEVLEELQDLTGREARKVKRKKLACAAVTFARDSFGQSRWRDCVAATTTVISNHCRETIESTVDSLELRAAVWIQLEHWDQVITDTTAVLRYQAEDQKTTIRAFARRALARYRLGLETHGLHHKHCALVDATMSRKLEKPSDDGAEIDREVLWPREDVPRLMRAKVFRGVGMLEAAQGEFETLLSSKKGDWNLLWLLGDCIAARTGVQWSEDDAFSTSLGSNRMTDASVSEWSDVYATNAISHLLGAMHAAQAAGQLELLPLRVVMTYGNLQLARIRKKNIQRAEDRKLASRFANSDNAGAPSRRSTETTLVLKESCKELVDNFELAAARFESNNALVSDANHRNMTLLRAAMTLQLARVYFELEDLSNAKASSMKALRLLAQYQGLPAAVEIEISEMNLSSDVDDNTVSSKCSLQQEPEFKPEYIISNTVSRGLEALSRLVYSMSLVENEETKGIFIDSQRRRRRAPKAQATPSRDSHTHSATSLKRSAKRRDDDSSSGYSYATFNEGPSILLAAAERQLVLADQLAPENIDVLCARAAVRRARGNSVGALHDLDKVIRLEPGLSDAHIARATLYLYNLHDMDAAFKAANDAQSSARPSDARPRMLMVACSANRGNAVECQKHLSRACYMFPANAWIHRLRIMAATAIPRNTEDNGENAGCNPPPRDVVVRKSSIAARVTETFVHCLSQNDGISQTRFHEYQGHIFLLKNRHESASEAFEAALSAPSEENAVDHKNRRRAILGLVDASLLTGNFYRALELIEMLSESIKDDLDLARLEHLRARANACLGSAEPALAAFGKALELYTRIVDNQGLAIETSEFQIDYRGHRKAETVKAKTKQEALEQATRRNVLTKFEVSNRSRESVLSRSQRGRAVVLYHRALFRAAVTLRRGPERSNELTGEGSSLVSPKSSIKSTKAPSTDAGTSDKPSVKQESVEDFEMRQIVAKWLAEALRRDSPKNRWTSAYAALRRGRNKPVQMKRKARKKAVAEPPATPARPLLLARRDPPRCSDVPRYSVSAMAALGAEDLDGALRQDPKLHEARIARAEYHAMAGNFSVAVLDCQAALDAADFADCRSRCCALICRGVIQIQEGLICGNGVQLEAGRDLTEAISQLEKCKNGEKSFEHSVLMAYAAYNRGIARAASSKLWEAGLDFSFVIDILKSARVKIQLEGRVLQLFSAAFVNRAVVNHWLVNKAAECVKDVEEAASLEKRYADRKIRKADGDSLWGSIARENRLASVTVAESVLATSRVPQNRVLLLLLQRATFLRHIERNLEAAGACAAALAAQKQMQAVATAEQVAVILNSLAVSLYQFSKSKNGRDAAPPNKEKSKSVPSISPSCAMRHWSKLIRSAARGDRSLDEASASHLAKRALLCAIHARPDRARPRFNLSAILGRSKTGDTQLRSAKIVEIDHVPCRYVLAANSCDDGKPGEAEHELFHALGSVSYAQNSKLYPRELTADRVAACAAASKANISLNLAVLHQFCGENSAAENRYAKIEDLSPLLADTHARVLAIASWARASNALARYAAASHDEEFLVTARTESNRSLNEPAAIDDCLLATFYATSALSSIARHDFDDANKKLQFASDLVDATGADSLPPWLKAQSVAAIVWANRASAMMGIGNADHRDQTIDLLNKTLALLPRYSNLHRQLANSLHLANKFLLAMSALNCALAIQTNTAEEDVKPT